LAPERIRRGFSVHRSTRVLLGWRKKQQAENRASQAKSDGSRSVDPLWSRHVRRLVARNRYALRGSVVRRDTSGQPTTWIASINSTGLGEYLEREIAMRRVEELMVGRLNWVVLSTTR